MLTTTELLNRNVLFEEVTDNFFIEQQAFTLESIYSLNFSSNVERLFWWNSDETDAYLIKLSGEYYFVGIAPCDGYRDNRSSIYHFVCDKMEDLILDYHLVNEVPTPLDIIATNPRNSEHSGIVFTIAYYRNEQNEVLELVTKDEDDYYPTGKIQYHKELHLAAIPIVEKYFLEQKINQEINKSKKLKI